MSRKRELEQLLSQRDHENDMYVKRIALLEAEVNRLHEQEQAVLLAIQEANRAAVRINEEAAKNANNICTEANARRDELLREAQQKVAIATNEANIILEKANEYALSRRNEADAYYNERSTLADSLFEEKRIEGDSYFDERIAEADAYFENRRKEADAYSDNIRTDANIFVERTILASQKEVNKRKDAITELNTALYNASKCAAEQSEYFLNLMRCLAGELSESQDRICAEVDKCACNCAECESNCSINESIPLPIDLDNKRIVEDDSPDVPEMSGYNLTFEQAGDTFDANSNSSLDLASDTIEFECEDSLPADYDTPADLMRSIYTLEGRDIPMDDMSDTSPKGGLLFKDELEEATPFDSDDCRIPSDSELDSILDDVIGKRNK